jgi:hypothetical protein
VIKLRKLVMLKVELVLYLPHTTPRGKRSAGVLYLTDSVLHAKENTVFMLNWEMAGVVTDNGNRGQPACPEEWKMCKEERE